MDGHEKRMNLRKAGRKVKPSIKISKCVIY